MRYMGCFELVSLMCMNRTSGVGRHTCVIPEAPGLEPWGVVTIPLAQRVSTGEGGSVTCVELQPEMITVLRERLGTSEVQNVEVLQGDGRHMALAENSFDVVFLASQQYSTCITTCLQPSGRSAAWEPAELHLPFTA